MSSDQKRHQKPKCTGIPVNLVHNKNDEIHHTPKFLILIKDVPTFADGPILHTLLTKLHDRNIFPTFVYSLAELLKVPENIVKMKDYEFKNGRQVHHLPITQGSSKFMIDVVEHAIKSDPQLIIVDYMSESLVNANRMTSIATLKHYKVYFLKRRNNLDKVIDRLLDKISIGIPNRQDLANIRREQELDKWWNDSTGIILQHVPPEPYVHLQKDFWLKISGGEKKLDSDNNGESKENFPGRISDELFLEMTPALCFTDVMSRYYNNMENMLVSCEVVDEYEYFMKRIREEEYYNLKWAEENCTFVVVRDGCNTKEGRRLVDRFSDNLLKIGVGTHVIPVGEMIIDPHCMRIMSAFMDKFEWDFIRAFKTVVYDTFFQLYNHDPVVVLDSVHDFLVGPERYIKDALEKQWKVYIIGETDALSEEETMEEMIEIIKSRHSTFDTGPNDSDLVG